MYNVKFSILTLLGHPVQWLQVHPRRCVTVTTGCLQVDFHLDRIFHHLRWKLPTSLAATTTFDFSMNPQYF